MWEPRLTERRKGAPEWSEKRQKKKGVGYTEIVKINLDFANSQTFKSDSGTLGATREWSAGTGLTYIVANGKRFNEEGRWKLPTPSSSMGDE